MLEAVGSTMWPRLAVIALARSLILVTVPAVLDAAEIHLVIDPRLEAFVA